MPNFHTSLFESFIVNSTNSFDSLDTSDAVNVSSPAPPISSSSPKSDNQHIFNNHKPSMKILNINFQSIRNKKEELNNLIDSSHPDVIIGTETWLQSNIHSSELFPPNYEVLREDRTDGYGGVLLAIKSIYVIDKIELPSNLKCEAICQIIN
ncbi:hypothetical protein FSP39_020065 [Pinctada imbricata]|uniref:Endonuclease/exonuclease/phosphatase domain-containing protein n=1 Tax=Pinctada imbricata TaxID=66713 RepID=A0AA89C957_PINIB|nr:hypothetical protein FSP39_020065 [Pinctada imbricata]